MNKFNGIDFDNLVIVMLSLIVLFIFSCILGPHGRNDGLEVVAVRTAREVVALKERLPRRLYRIGILDVPLVEVI